MNNKAKVPVVDFSDLSIELSNEKLNNVKAESLAANLIEIFSTVGFVYLKNTGISFDLINEIQGLSSEFFNLPETSKSEYRYRNDHGWIHMNQEGSDVKRISTDLKECFNITQEGLDTARIPDECGDLLNPVKKLFAHCTLLSHRILYAIAIGLKLENSQYLIECHNTSTKPSNTVLRLLYYPPLPLEVKEDQVRLGEHTDYGSLTLLFQDEKGGLEIHKRDGEWIEATPIPDTVLVNIADLMQRWTSDRLLSTPHRVLNPDDEAKRRAKRQSIAFFFQPDRDAVITCLDGSNKYPPTLADEFLKTRLKEGYRY